VGMVGSSNGSRSCVPLWTFGWRMMVNGYRRKTAAFRRVNRRRARRGEQGISGCLSVSKTKTRLMRTILSDQLLAE